MESDWLGLAEWPWRGGVTPREWGLDQLRIMPGGLRPESAASRSLAAREREVTHRERAVERRERCVAVLGWAVAFALALEVLLALLVVGWGNQRLPAARGSAGGPGSFRHGVARR